MTAVVTAGMFGDCGNQNRPVSSQYIVRFQPSYGVTVTSSEFGISGLFVARQRYDYTKDVGLIASYSDRAIGMHVGPRLHFGPANDPTSSSGVTRSRKYWFITSQR